MKDFIRDKGVVRNCISNVSKMNALEHMWYIQGIGVVLFPLDVKELLRRLSSILGSFLGLVLCIPPLNFILAFVGAKIAIKSAKEESIK